KTTPSDDLPPISEKMVKGFCWYAPRFVGKSFSAVRRLGPVPEGAGDADGRPMLIYCNHPSWWDPMVIALLNHGPFRGRTHYGPIDEAGLAKYRFLERMGFFGIDPESRAGAAKFLRLGRAVLSRPGGTLWVTAEGHFTDPRKRPVRLRPGVAHLARKVSGGVAVPLAIEYPFGMEKLPEMRFAFGEPVETGDMSRGVEQWNADLEARLESTMDRLSAATVAGDTLVFETVQAGKVGVNPVYDLWRRLRALLGGKRFDASHGAGLQRGGRNFRGGHA
ncbi:MAG: lysophospholipid acyltransferase family protein, partial [Planctomycetota bacterium]